MAYHSNTGQKIIQFLSGSYFPAYVITLPMGEILQKIEYHDRVHKADTSSLGSCDAMPCPLSESSSPTVYNQIYQTKTHGGNADKRLRAGTPVERPQALASTGRPTRIMNYSIKFIHRGGI